LQFHNLQLIGIYGRILKANLSWSPTRVKFCFRIRPFIFLSKIVGKTFATLSVSSFLE